MRGMRISLACAALAAALVPATAASAAGMPAGGQIELIATAGSSPYGTIVIAGAIGGSGKTLSMTKSGKPDANGNYVKITLQNGTFEVNSTVFNEKTAKAPASIANKATCSFAFAGSGPVTLFNGTGLYAGISGTVTITINYVGYGPLYTSGAEEGHLRHKPDRATPGGEGLDHGPRDGQVRLASVRAASRFVFLGPHPARSAARPPSAPAAPAAPRQTCLRVGGATRDCRGHDAIKPSAVSECHA